MGQTEAGSIGSRIAALRKAKGWTQAELAERLTVSDKAVSKWEKDAGEPSLAYFPVLADLFGVSIDYLMTGETFEKGVVIMSKAEYCVTKGDVKLLTEVDCRRKDEQGKTLVDYLWEYRDTSGKVFCAFCELKKEHVSYFSLLQALELCLINNRLDLLNGGRFSQGEYVELNGYRRFQERKLITFSEEYGVLDLLPKSAEPFFDKQTKWECVLTEEILSLMVTDKRINESTLKTLFGTQRNRACVAYHIYPYWIDAAYKAGDKKMVDRLLKNAKESNQFAYGTIPSNPKYDFRSPYAYTGNGVILKNFFLSYPDGQTKIEHGIVRVLHSTIKRAIENCDVEYAKKFDELNKDVGEHYVQFKWNSPCVSEREWFEMEVKQNKKMSEEERFILLNIVFDGVINVEKLLELEDVGLVKRILSEYPLSDVEKALQWAKAGKREELSAWCRKRDLMASWCFLDMKGLLRVFSARFSQLVPKEMEKYVDLDSRTTTTVGFRTIRREKTGEEFIIWAEEKFDEFRQAIINSLLLKQSQSKDLENNEKFLEGLSKEYFLNELKKENAEMVVVKLCVRLEALLKANYGYEGDFVDMLGRYCLEHEYDREKIRLLNALRVQRNNIVHATLEGKQMSVKELVQCIEYICNLQLKK